MATSYEELYSRCLSKIEDYGLAMIPEEDMENTLHGWLMSAAVKMLYKRTSSDLTKVDDENQCFEDDLDEIEKEVLAILMVNEWLTPQINSVLLTKQFIGGKEEKLFSQSSHLSELQALRDANRTEANKLLRDYSYRSANSYFDN